jgi:transposase-like protein
MCELKSPFDFESLLDVADYFKDEETCLRYLESWYYSDGITCPFCLTQESIYKYKDGKRFKCYPCNKVFTLKVGTIFHKSHIPLRKWFMVMYLFGVNNGISSCKVAKLIKIRQPTAWFMLHRIRALLDQKDVGMSGVIESDECVIGGKNGNRHYHKRVKKYAAGRRYIDKTPVIGLLQHGEIKKTKIVVINDVSSDSLKRVIYDTVESGSVLVTDDHHSYHVMMDYYDHKTVDHSAYQFSDGRYSTNGVENMWSHLKRMIGGIYVNVTPKHLQRYCDEFAFKFNTRHLSGGEKLKYLLQSINCRLSYKNLTR